MKRMQNDADRKEISGKEKRTIIICGIIAVVIVLVVTGVFKPVLVSGTSMEPGFSEGDRVMLLKTAYLRKEHPEYGDIVVFKTEYDSVGITKKELLIKRVIGVEGDRIMIKDGCVYRNGRRLNEPYAAGQTTYPDGGGDSEDVHVAKDKIFVLGDNRNVSIDSRNEDIGQVEERQIIGKAILQLTPINRIRRLD